MIKNGWMLITNQAALRSIPFTLLVTLMLNVHIPLLIIVDTNMFPQMHTGGALTSP